MSEKLFDESIIKGCAISDNVMNMVRKAFDPHIQETIDGVIVFYVVGKHVVLDSIEARV